MDSQTQPEVPKTERKVVIAEYANTEAFKVPDGIDLENDKQVKDWGVKYDTLYIYMVDGTEIKVNSVGWLDDALKYPNDTTIEDASDWNLDEDDEEDEDEED
jgi:hypothetical protein